MNLLALPVLVPMLAGVLVVLSPSRAARFIVSLTGSVVQVVLAVIIVVRALRGEVMALQMADWVAPYGITVVADSLSALLLLAAGLAGLLSVVYANGGVSERHERAAREGELTENRLLDLARERFGLHGLLQFLFMGVNMSLLSGDLFNLFVAFEVMLVASYGLLLLGGERRQLREGFRYVVVNLVASALFVIGAGLVYGLVGSLNMADIGQRVMAHGADLRLTLVCALLALVFATKAALFPLGFWLPDAYPAPPVAIGAYFASVLTKVGVYALVRTFMLMFPGQPVLQDVLLVLGVATALVGALGMLARHGWRHIAAFANVSSVGFLAAAFFAGSERALAVGVFYLFTSMAVVYAMFVVSGVAESMSGSDVRIPGHLERHPWLGVGYFVVGLTLIGVPPTSGFLGKYGLVQELITRGPLGWGAAATALLASLVLIYAVFSLWSGYFWGTRTESTSPSGSAAATLPDPRAAAATTVGPLVDRDPSWQQGLVAVLSVVLVAGLAVFGGPVFRTSATVAAQLDGHAAYSAAVLDPGGFGPLLGPRSSDD